MGKKKNDAYDDIRQKGFDHVVEIAKRGAECIDPNDKSEAAEAVRRAAAAVKAAEAG